MSNMKIVFWEGKSYALFLFIIIINLSVWGKIDGFAAVKLVGLLL
jgi:hypothetical protein